MLSRISTKTKPKQTQFTPSARLGAKRDWGLYGGKRGVTNRLKKSHDDFI